MPAKYFAMIDGVRQGPFLLEELADAGVRPDTYVWRKGWADWRRALEDGEICRYFRQRLSNTLPQPEQPAPTPEPQQQPEAQNYDNVPLRFRNMVPPEDADEFSSDAPQEDRSVPPKNMILPCVLAILLCFPLTGFVALFYTVKSSRTWKQGDADLAYEYARRSKMWLGITVSLGFIVMAIGIRKVGFL